MPTSGTARGGPYINGYQKRLMLETANIDRDLAANLRWLWRLEGPPEAVLCIGTDRSTGDALGPLIGMHLNARPELGLTVVGTIDFPVHAANLQQIIQQTPSLLQQRVLAVDASLGRLEDIGAITFGVGPLRPGAGVNKQLPAIGRYYLTGTVNVGGFMEYFVLQNTRLSLVMKMAAVMGAAIINSLVG